ncbi:general transcription factor 3C polypeptide 3-like isoform X2 [Ostrea edulis]|uniref:general transcription factor 3C polypeptide 3-like isoform X2 n=1 Tax=Ostrea edulis TaxID=37623 RepID=UPI002095FF6F|nr:general transcription factor 3C polypeptide 3-like isoform X2 [Ostrea edulis]
MQSVNMAGNEKKDIELTFEIAGNEDSQVSDEPLTYIIETIGSSSSNEVNMETNDSHSENVQFVEVPADQLANLGLLATISSDQSRDDSNQIIQLTAADDLQNISIATEPGTSGFQLVQGGGESDFVMPGIEPTLQYLTGKISFAEFSQLMESGEPDATVELDNVIQTIEVTDVVTDVKMPEEDAQEEEEEPEDSTSQSEDTDSLSPKKKTRKRKKKYNDLPIHLEGMMGEANLKFAKGDHEEAISICMEIIRMAPEAYMPFQTLGMIYEDQGDLKKSLQYSLIAAYLNPVDRDGWIRLAELSLELQDKQQAIICYSKAIRADPQNPSNLDIFWNRSHLYEELGEKKRALEGYKAMMKIAPPKDGDRYMELARTITKHYYEEDDKVSAMETMKNAFESNSENVTAEDVNLIMELLMTQKMFLQAIEVLVNHCGVVFNLNINREWSKDVALNTSLIENGAVKIVSVAIPELLPIDLRVKLGICLIQNKLNGIAQVVVTPLFNEDMEEVGDLYLDVAEAYMDQEYFAEAKSILQQLVHSENFNLAAVWLRLAECLNSLGELEGAVDAYSKVVEMAPSHIGARMSLSTLQQHLGKHEEALKVLQRDESDGLLTKQEKSLLMHKCMLLHAQGKFDEFQDTCKSLLFNMFKNLNDPDFIKAVYCCRSYKTRRELLQEHFKQGYKESTKSEIPVDDLWDLFVKLCEMLLNNKKYEDLLQVTALGMSCPYFMLEPRKLKQTEFMCLIACLLTKNESFAFSHVREICIKEGNKNQVWNLLNQVLLIATENRHNRFYLRYLLNNPDHVPVELINGHNAALSGTYKYALGEYVAVLRHCPEDPLVNLCIGLTFIHLAGQKFSSKKHSLFCQGLTFLNNYTELRGECQETYYNMGRALHQLGLTYAAVHYYKKGLSYPPVVEDEENRFDLTRQLAYNLMLIYKNSGSDALARQIMHQYLVI